MKCNKKCEKCENLNSNFEITLEIQSGLFPHRRYIKGVKCTKYGQNAYSVVELPHSQQFNDIIYQ